MAKEKRLLEMSEDDRRKEREANYFAMELLMPENWLLRDAKELFPGGLDLENTDAIKKLAKKYQVSEQIMTIRLTQVYFDSAI